LGEFGRYVRTIVAAADGEVSSDVPVDELKINTVSYLIIYLFIFSFCQDLQIQLELQICPFTIGR
jgi:hypothetical protein